MDDFMTTYMWPALIIIGQSVLLLVVLLVFIAYILLADRKGWGRGDFSSPSPTF